MVVLKLVRVADRETLAVLQALLARALRREIFGLALCIRLEGGEEKTVFTGCYRDRATAASAAMGMSWRLTQMHDSARRPP